MGNYGLGAYVVAHELHSPGERPAVLGVGVTLLLGATGLLALDRFTRP
jgi:hypothetical protein